VPITANKSKINGIHAKSQNRTKSAFVMLARKLISVRGKVTLVSRLFCT